MALSRRKFLAGLLLAVLGLAWFTSSQDRTTDITLSNETSHTVTVHIQVTKMSDDTRLLDDTVPIDVDGDEEYQEVVSGSQVEVHLRVENGLEKTKEWYDGESDATGLHIEINEDSINIQGFIV